ncbi:hypothetical protein BH18CHL2_BH18CHL2_06950 [soil metagenome]
MLASVLVASGIALSGLWQGLAVPNLQAALTRPLEGSRAGSFQDETSDEPEAMPGGNAGDAAEAVAAAGAKATLGDPPGWVRLPKPEMPTGPRRVGIQAGHWLTQEAPADLWRLIDQTGTSWDGVNEWEANLEMAYRVAAILERDGLVVDVLPTVIPPGYLADAFVALHWDGDGVGEKSGFKLAHSGRRTPHEDALQRLVTEEYGNASGLRYDALGVSGNMRGYYAHAWSRVRYSTSPFTPSVILEMGFLSSDHDRSLLLNEPENLANGVAAGIRRFLDATPRDALFGQDLVVPPAPVRRSPSPSPTAP